MSDYIDIAELKMLGSMPAEDVDDVEARYPGITAATITAVSGMFDARLRKRYAVPFEAPYPQPLKMAVSGWVAYRLWLKRGFNPSAEHNGSIELDYTEAKEWLSEAANSETGLIELPKKEEPLGPGAVSAGGPLGYSEASPYAWTTLQRGTGQSEDSNG